VPQAALNPLYNGVGLGSTTVQRSWDTTIMKKIFVCLSLAGLVCLQTVCARAAQTNWVMTASFQLTVYAQGSHYVSKTKLIDDVDRSKLVTKSILSLLNGTTNLDTNGVVITNLIPVSSSLVLKQDLGGSSAPFFAARYRHGSATLDIPLDNFVVCSIPDGVRSGYEKLTTGASTYSAKQYVTVTYTNQQGTGFFLGGLSATKEASVTDRTAGDLGVLPKSIVVSVSGDGMIAGQAAVFEGRLTLNNPKAEVR
jgi:hypothetical protein